MKEFIKKLNVGDKVIRKGTNGSMFIGTVTKITAQKNVSIEYYIPLSNGKKHKINDEIYNSDGMMINQGKVVFGYISSPEISEWTLKRQKDFAKVEKRNEIKKIINNAVKYDNLTIGQLEAIVSIIKQ